MSRWIGPGLMRRPLCIVKVSADSESAKIPSPRPPAAKKKSRADMSVTILEALQSDYKATAPGRKRARVVVEPALLDDGHDLVLDANRLRVSRDAGTCWLKTVDPNFRLRVMADHSVWVYRDVGNGSFAR